MHFSASLKSQKFVAVIGLGVILTIGAGIRLHGVEYRTLSHPEAYTPGIDLPWHLSNPNPRFTLSQTLAGSIAGEPHPPGYYILMLGWTKWFGSSILSLRLPSVLFGAASILLIYVLAYHTENTFSALVAAAMLALNGLHLYWSQYARMYSMACFLGLLSTVLLVLIIKQSSRQRTHGILYVAVTVAGLATHVYFWPLFISQAVWICATHLRARSLPGLLRLQIFTFIVATPLLAIAAYQTGFATRPTTLSPLRGVLQFLQLGSLLESDPLVISTGFLGPLLETFALLATALFIAAAAVRKKIGERQSIGDIQGYASPHLAVTAAVAVLAGLSILVFAYFAKILLPGRSTRLVVAVSVLPLALLFIDVLFCKYWERFKHLRTTLAQTSWWPGSLGSVNFFLAILPISIVAVISLFNPIFIQRATLLFAPFLLIVLATGLTNLLRRDYRWSAIVLLLVIIHVISVVHFKSEPSNRDYKALAEQWVPQIEESDLIFVHGRGHPADWAVAPIFYYLNAARYHFVGRDFIQETQEHSHSRVWVLSFPGVPTEKEAIDALSGYAVRKRIDARNISAQLYVVEAPALPVAGNIHPTDGDRSVIQ